MGAIFFRFRHVRRHVRVHETEACEYLRVRTSFLKLTAGHKLERKISAVSEQFPPIRDEPVIDNNKVKMAERERKVPDNHSSTTCSEANGDTTSK